MNDRGEGIVGGLGAVHIVVRVNEFAAKVSAHDFSTTVRDNFVGVHVGLGTRTGLPDNKGEMVSEFALNDLISSFDDGVSFLGVKSIVQVSFCSGFLQDTEGTDNRDGHTLAFASNFEVLERALSLGSPVAVSGNLDRAKGVCLLSKLSGE